MAVSYTPILGFGGILQQLDACSVVHCHHSIIDKVIKVHAILINDKLYTHNLEVISFRELGQ